MDSLKILFIRSGGHFVDIYFPEAPMISPPKSLLFLAGVFVEDPSINTELLDILASPDLKKIKQTCKAPPFYFGMSDDDIISSIKKSKPDIIAITSTANYFFKDTLAVIKLIKKYFPQIFIAIGGPDATNDYKDYFEQSNDFDVLVIGEGELTFKELVYKIKNNEDWKQIQGISYRDDNDEIHLTPARPYINNLDNYRCDYTLVDFPKYFELCRIGFPSRLSYKHAYSHHSIDMVTSRGCPYNCSFCSIHLHMGKKTRCHSPAYVLREMQLLIEKYDVRNFHFEDDLLLHNMERFKEILRGIINNGWNITWDTPNGVRADQIEDEFLDLCQKSGCTYLIFGIESGNQNVLDSIVDKSLNLETIIESCKKCYEYEIDTMAFYIVGMPGETQEDLNNTYDFAFMLFKKYNTTPIFQLWRPYKNTPMEMKIRDHSSYAQNSTYSLHKEHELPFTLFYSKVHENSEIPLEFLSSYFKRYLNETIKIVLINWIKITKKKPLVLIQTLIKLLFMLTKSVFRPYSNKFIVQQFISSIGILPFAQVNKKEISAKN